MRPEEAEALIHSTAPYVEKTYRFWFHEGPIVPSHTARAGRIKLRVFTVEVSDDGDVFVNAKGKAVTKQGELYEQRIDDYAAPEVVTALREAWEQWMGKGHLKNHCNLASCPDHTR